MSESEAYEEVSVASDGVTVTKRYEADEFPVPAIAFNFESDRGEAVTVELTDAVPDDVAVEDLGFHPEYGSEYWNIEDEEITFEREIEPGAEYTTVYGIRATGTDNVEQFLSEPNLESVDPPLEDDEGALVGEGDDAVKDVISGDSDSVPGLEEENEDVETLDLKDPNNEGSASSSSSSSSSSSESTSENGDAGSVEVSGDTLITALANELREQEVSKDDVKLLRKAFDLASDDKGSVKARVTKLQQEVSEVIAYTDALEEFLDENGTAEDMIGEFRSDLEEFQRQVDEFESQLDSIEDGVVTEDDLAALEGDIDAVESEVDDIASSVESVEETVGSVEESVDAVESDVDAVENSVDSVESTVDELDGELDDLQGELEEIREEAASGDVEARIDDIEDDIVQLKEWREQLSSVIGGGE